MSEIKEGHHYTSCGHSRVIKECYKQLCPHKCDNLDVMGQFLERYNPPKLTLQGIDKLNRSVSIKEIEPTINLTKQKAPGLEEFTGKFYQTLNGEIILLL